MSRHEGVSCDSCLTGNFRGRRYKCLVCYDCDLCSNCFENGAITTRHSNTHAMQCVLTRSDHELFYGGEMSGHSGSSSHPLSMGGSESTMSYTCPYCAKLGFTEGTLVDHVASQHSDNTQEVVCPICAALPGGDPNHVTNDFSAHLTHEHRSGPRDLISFLDSPGGGSRESGGGSITRPLGVRRVPHTSRGMGGVGRARRAANVHNPNLPSSALSSLSPSATGVVNSREHVDPIAELLSQLSGVRRSTTGSSSSSSSQLQQLQMQLQLERQQQQHASRRSSEHRAAPRARSGFVFGRSTTSGLPSANGGANIFSGNGSIGSNGNPVVSVQHPNQPGMDGEMSFSEGGTIHSSAGSGSGTSDSTEIFLLRQNSDEEQENQSKQLDPNWKRQKSQFIQELVLSTLLEESCLVAGKDKMEKKKKQV